MYYITYQGSFITENADEFIKGIEDLSDKLDVNLNGVFSIFDIKDIENVTN